MRYRKLTTTGDYSFGRGTADFWVNSPQGVAQSVRTRLLLFQGEWFLDKTQGTPWASQVLGYGTKGLYDLAIRARVLGTPGVLQDGTGIQSYQSTLVPPRRLVVSMTINTQFGGPVAVAGGANLVFVPGGP